MQVQLIHTKKVVDEKTSKDGKKHVFHNFFFLLEDGTKVYVRPAFDRDKTLMCYAIPCEE